MCRNDRAGKGLRLTLHDHQCIIGSSGLFLNEDPNTYNYGMDNTRWYFIWKSIWENSIKAEFHYVWLPHGRGRNNRNIMEVATKDEEIINSRWCMLDHINRCRLYLNAFYVSDLSKDGRTVEMGYLDGTKRKTHEYLQIPDIRKPTAAQWRVWKSFIFRNFLSPGLTIHPAIQYEVTQEKPLGRKPSEIDTIVDLYGTEGTLEEILLQFPTVMHPMIGQVTFPEDGGLQLCHRIVEGECKGVSDGSLVKDFYEVKGGFGYVLSQNNSDHGSITGIGTSPETDEMSSQTAEHQGLIGLLCVIHAMCIKFKLCHEECWGNTTIYIDNKNVVERAGKAQEPYNISDYQVPDQDLWSLTTSLIRVLPIKLNIKWIRSHQDTNTYGEVIHGPFRRHTQLNIWTDKLASEGMKRSDKLKVPRPVFSMSVAVLKTKEGLAIQNLQRYLLKTRNGEELLDYYRKRKGWHSRVISTIDWEALEMMLKKSSAIKKNRIIQVLHDWQNVGKQKGKFRNARLAKMADPPLQATVEEETIHLCPFECGETEDPLHYVRCQNKGAMESREKWRKQALGKLKKLRTNECIISFVGYVLLKISLREDISLEDITFNTIDERELIPALVGQQQIGWDELLKGFAHKGWARAQTKHYGRLGLTSKIYSEKRWKRMFLTILTGYSNECWTNRNETIHGDSMLEGRQVRRTKLKRQVQELYGKKLELRGSPLRKIFNMSLSQRLKQGVQSLELWVGKAEEVLKLHREEADKNTLDRWLSHR